MREDRRAAGIKPPDIFSDFDTSFNRSPVTRNLSRLTNERAVKRAVANIIGTNRGEWPYHSTLGSNINAMLFEPMTDTTAELIRETMADALELEPRITVLELVVTADEERNGYAIRLIFQIRNWLNPVEYTQFLRRVR